MKGLSVWACLLVLLLAGGCAGMWFGTSWGPAPAGGWLYTEMTYPHARVQVANDGIGSKRGEAMAKVILGLVAVGDASMEAAIKDGKIRKVYTVDHKLMNILGVYQEWSTIVTGE